MLSLLVPGVFMGASSTGEEVGLVHRLMVLGVGRMWWIPFLLFAGNCW
jgi:hypothetical protein